MSKATKAPKMIAGVRLVRESSFPAPEGYAAQTLIRIPNDVARFMQPHVARECAEVLWILALDSQQRVIGNSPIVVTRGVLNSSLVHPREIFRAALSANACSIIVVHNHPSGDPTQSMEDRMVCESLKAAGLIMQVPMRDFIVIGEGVTYSSALEIGIPMS